MRVLDSEKSMKQICTHKPHISETTKQLADQKRSTSRHSLIRNKLENNESTEMFKSTRKNIQDETTRR